MLQHPSVVFFLASYSLQRNIFLYCFLAFQNVKHIIKPFICTEMLEKQHFKKLSFQ